MVSIYLLIRPLVSFTSALFYTLKLYNNPLIQRVNHHSEATLFHQKIVQQQLLEKPNATKEIFKDCHHGRLSNLTMVVTLLRRYYYITLLVKESQITRHSY